GREVPVQSSELPAQFRELGALPRAQFDVFENQERPGAVRARQDGPGHTDGSSRRHGPQTFAFRLEHRALFNRVDLHEEILIAAKPEGPADAAAAGRLD